MTTTILNYNMQSLSNYDFACHNLRNAQFINTNLSGSNFSNSDLRYANFQFAILDDCKLNGALFSFCIPDNNKFIGLQLPNCYVIYCPELQELAINHLQFPLHIWKTQDLSYLQVNHSITLQAWSKYRNLILQFCEVI